MANLFQNNQAAPQIPPRQKLEAKYNAARANLMLAVAFTLINIVILLSNGSSYFLFSLFFPRLITGFGMEFYGKLPPEYYAEFYPEGIEFLPSSALWIFVAIAVVIVAVYALCWLFSSKGRVGWMIAALVLFSLDTAFLLLGGFATDTLVDVLFHVWVLYYLIAGIIAHFKLKTLPPDEEPVTDGIVMEVSAEDAPVAQAPSEPSDGDDKPE